MSFKVWYKASAEIVLSLPGLIGDDGKVYWFVTDVNEILGFSRNKGFFKNYIHVRNVAGSRSLSRYFRNRRIFGHDIALTLFSQSSMEHVREFGRKLSSPESRVLCLKREPVGDFKVPTQLLLCDYGPDFWFVWYAFFREEAMRTRMHF